jgi:hypothetical protein
VGRPEPGAGQPLCRRPGERSAGGRAGGQGGDDDAPANEGAGGIPSLGDGREPDETTSKATSREREPSAIRLTPVLKQRKGRRLERIAVRATIGEPVEPPSLVHRGRLNGTRRDRLNCLTRTTHGFAKDVETGDALFRLALVEQNWLHPPIALRVPLPEPHRERRSQQRTPAMAMHLTNHPWSWEEFVLFRVQQC